MLALTDSSKHSAHLRSHDESGGRSASAALTAGGSD